MVFVFMGGLHSNAPLTNYTWYTPDTVAAVYNLSAQDINNKGPLIMLMVHAVQIM